MNNNPSAAHRPPTQASSFESFKRDSFYIIVTDDLKGIDVVFCQGDVSTPSDAVVRAVEVFDANDIPFGAHNQIAVFGPFQPLEPTTIYALAPVDPS